MWSEWSQRSESSCISVQPECISGDSDLCLKVPTSDGFTHPSMWIRDQCALWKPLTPCKVECDRVRGGWRCFRVIIFVFLTFFFCPSPLHFSIFIPQSCLTVHMSVSKPPPPPSTSHLAIPPSSASTPSSSASSPSVTPHSIAPPPPSPVKISMQEHFAINVCPGPILPIPQISDFFPRFHDYPCTPPPPREKKILKEETFNGETGGGYKDGERRGENEGDREELIDSDDDDSEFCGGESCVRSSKSGVFIHVKMTKHRSIKKQRCFMQFRVEHYLLLLDLSFCFFPPSPFRSTAYACRVIVEWSILCLCVCHSHFMWHSGSNDLLHRAAIAGLWFLFFPKQ